MKGWHGVLVGMAIVASMAQSECGEGSEADRRQAAATAELAAEADRQVGMPGIANFTEKRLLRQLYELRDQEIATFTYIVDLEGHLHHVCDSIGFGMPFSAQFSNPQRLVYPSSTGRTTLPQPEPNGIFLPDSTSATWVICAAPEGEFRPVYVEPTITVSTFPLNHVGSYTERAQ